MIPVANYLGWIRKRPRTWMACLGLVVIVFTILWGIRQAQIEKKVAQYVEQLGGKVEWQYGCVRYVSLGRVVSMGITEPYIDDDKLCEVIEQLNRLFVLKSLDLSESGITDRSSKCLGTLKNVQWLYIDYTNLTDASVGYIARIDTLNYLSIQDTKITDMGVQYLRENSNSLCKINRYIDVREDEYISGCAGSNREEEWFSNFFEYLQKHDE